VGGLFLMKKISKRLLSMMLVFVMLFALIPFVAASAEETDGLDDGLPVEGVLVEDDPVDPVDDADDADDADEEPVFDALVLDEYEAPVLDAQNTHYIPEHSAIVKRDGTLWTWGNNSDGQIGDGTMLMRSTPYLALQEVTVASAGGIQTLAVRTNGDLYAWGGNTRGQVGDNTTSRKVFPVWINTTNTGGQLPRITDVSAGENHSLAITTTGDLYAWGDNSRGQLGVGVGISSSLRPMKVPGISEVIAVSAGSEYTMAITENGDLYAWGRNSSGQLGDGTTDDKFLPVNLGGLGVGLDGGVTNVSASFGRDSAHTVAVKWDGSLWAWGANHNGQLGDGTTTQRLLPRKIRNNGVAGAEAGPSYTAMIRTDGTLWTWGFNAHGRLGDGTNFESMTPVQVMDNVNTVSLGYNVTTVIKQDGTLWNMGANFENQLGDGTRTERWSPGYITNELRLTQLSPQDIATNQFIQRLYRTIMHRPADVDGLNFWRGELRSGRFTGSTICEWFFNSPEYNRVGRLAADRDRANRDFVADLYRTCLGREPDTRGYNFWLNQLNHSVSDKLLMAQFFGTPEFAQVCALYFIPVGQISITENADRNASMTMFVHRNYAEFLGRAPDRSGLNYWTGMMFNNNMSASWVSVNFVFSIEFVNKGYTNDQFLDFMYRGMMGREPDAAGKAYWLNIMRQYPTVEWARRVVFNGFVSSPEFARLCASFGVRPV